jgi:Tfp pilus assembly protein PilW
MAVFVLIVVGMLEMFDFVRLTYVKGERKLDVQQNTRLAMDMMARELRSAGYFPENYDGDPAVTLATAAEAINDATATSLAFSGDLAGNCNPSMGPSENPTPATCAGNASQTYLYCFDAANAAVRRKVTSFTNPTSGVPGAGAFTCDTNAAVLAENVKVPTASSPEPGLTFTYYDMTNNLIPLPMSALDRQRIQSIVIKLIGEESVPGPGQLPQRFTLTQTVRLRIPNRAYQ